LDGASRTPPEAHAYAAAIDRAAAADSSGAAGIGLVAHAYARYLGDLSGGQILKPLVARALGLAPDQLTFYDFPGIDDMAAAKADLRRALDRIAPGSPEATIVLDEAIAAFRHTIAVSTAVSTMMVG
jgi:heme oxygenase